MNVQFAQKFGAVYWDLNILRGLCKKLTFPTCCYFYDARPNSSTYGTVIYKAEITRAYCVDDVVNLRNNPNQRRFIPEWRDQCIEGRWTNRNTWVVRNHPNWIGQYHRPSKVWIRLENFVKLNPPKIINDFRKCDGSILRGWRGAYILCP